MTIAFGAVAPSASSERVLGGDLQCERLAGVDAGVADERELDRTSRLGHRPDQEQHAVVSYRLTLDVGVEGVGGVVGESHRGPVDGVGRHVGLDADIDRGAAVGDHEDHGELRLAVVVDDRLLLAGLPRDGGGDRIGGSDDVGRLVCTAVARCDREHREERAPCRSLPPPSEAFDSLPHRNVTPPDARPLRDISRTHVALSRIAWYS